MVTPADPIPNIIAPSRTFDATDKQFQRHFEFPPNKESAWSSPIDSNELTLAHQLIRGELKLLMEAVQDTLDSCTFDEDEQRIILSDWKIRALKRSVQIHLQNVRIHQKAEKQVYIPWLETRIRLYHPKIDAAQAALMMTMKELEKTAEKLQADSPKSLRSLRRSLRDYEAILLPLLEKKDEFIVPLLRAYFTHPEMRRIVRRANRANTINKNGAFIYHQGEEFFRNTYMQQEKKARFRWHLFYRSQLQIYEKNFVRPLENIKQDQEPEEESSFLPLFCNIL